MVDTVNIKTAHQPSKLAKLPLSFEYDKTLREIKQSVKIRTSL
jgi:hypothetical protein